MNEVKRYKMFTETRGDVEVVLAADYVRDVGELQRQIAELTAKLAEAVEQQEYKLVQQYVSENVDLREKLAELEQYIAEQDGRNNESLEQPSTLKIVPSTASDGTA